MQELFHFRLLVNKVTCGGVVRVVVDGPVASLAWVVARSGYLPEGLVQRQVVSDGVLEGVDAHAIITEKPFAG